MTVDYFSLFFDQALHAEDMTLLLQQLDHDKSFSQWVETLKLQVPFQNNRSRLVEALTHPSFAHEQKNWPWGDNQRLEFLGDAALDLFMSKKLFTKFEDCPEGLLSKLRSSIVNEEVLARWAKVLHIDKWLLVGKGLQGKPYSDSMVADAFESLVGMLSLTLPLAQWEEVLTLWLQIFEAQSGEELFSLKRLESFDPKTSLQEKTLMLYRELPIYKAEELEDGSLFQVSIELKGKVIAVAKSMSKRKAQKEAARKVLNEKTYLGL